ncbi:endolytic transglycosylase MltG [Marinibaculum pumilum]|uniref:Endolytic murein transglycosylase n=1 Tax=Marinibaculum pumilum TaxID=1766165 RepID=A0ABV7KTQ8_9PROT
MRRAILRLFAGLFGLLLIAAAVAFWGWQQWIGPGPSTEQVNVVIPKGTGVGGIAARLEQAGVVADATLFRAGVLAEGASRSLQAGEYAFDPGISPAGVLAKLRSGDRVLHQVTVPEGLTVRQVATLLQAQSELTGEIEKLPPEGRLLPETYAFERGDSRQSVIDRMAAAMDAALQQLWEGRAEGLPIDSPDEALVLASIVERETGIAEERPLVAGVFTNRLRKGMRLQSDPTVIYGVSDGLGTLGRPLSRTDLKTPTDWNTYVIAGLPPTPIANPSRAALAAVLDPAETDYLYFVADGTGGHVFAASLAEHNRNVRAWRAQQRKDRVSE